MLKIKSNRKNVCLLRIQYLRRIFWSCVDWLMYWLKNHYNRVWIKSHINAITQYLQYRFRINSHDDGTLTIIIVKNIQNWHRSYSVCCNTIISNNLAVLSTVIHTHYVQCMYAFGTYHFPECNPNDEPFWQLLLTIIIIKMKKEINN